MLLNRNDRKALRRNRAAVSYLMVVIAILMVVIISFYRDNSDLHNQIKQNLSEFEQYQLVLKNKNKTIDSLSKSLEVTNLKSDSTKITIKQIIKPKPIKIDSSIIQKKDTSNKSLKDSI